MRVFPYLAAAMIALATGGPAGADPFGGDADSLAPGSGYFRTERDDTGRWWLLTPAGNRFWAMGLDVIRPDWEAEPTYQAKYGASPTTWATVTLGEVSRMGFNTIGSNHHDRKHRWQDALRKAEPRLPYVLDFAPFPFHDPRKPGQPRVPFIDVFSDTFERRYLRAAKEIPTDVIADPYLIGYLFNNELNWGLFGHFSGLWQDHVSLPAPSPGKQAFVAHLKERYGGDIARFRATYGNADALLAEGRMLSTAGEGPVPEDVRRRVRAAYTGPRAPKFDSWDDVAAFTDIQLLQTAVRVSSTVKDDIEAFLGIISDRYHEVASRAVRSVDSHHLLLGCKFIGGKWYGLPDPVVVSAARYVDVISQNVYFKPGTAAGRRQLDFIERTARISRRPQLLSEWGGFHGQDARRCRCYIPVKDQAERGRLLGLGVEQLAASPYVVGAFYYSYADHDAKNWGVFDSSLNPYPDVAAATSRVGPRAIALHGSGPPP